LPAQPTEEGALALKLSRDTTEILVGGLAVLAFALFVVFAFSVNQSSVTGYVLTARYNHIDGLALHADVRLAGVRVGEVTAEAFEPDDNRALVTMTITNGVVIPRDSAAIVASEGLLGAKFVKIDAGGDLEMLKPGDSFDYVQDSVDLEHLLQRVVQDAEAKRKAGQRKLPVQDDQ
jgi:phospholipid/cholesterol/gamma-HCH transport system substrate-binding protein